MGKHRDTYVVFAILALLLFCSCSKEDDIDLLQGDVPQFFLGTKALAQSGTTFRIMAYGAEQDNHFATVASGTYSLQGKSYNGFEYLTASLLTDVGEFVSEDSSKALAVPYDQSGKEFYITYVSPGAIDTNGGFTADLNNPFYCSDVQKTVMNNYGKVEMSKDLIDRRAKIGFRLYKDKEDKIVDIKDLRIIGAGNTYWPVSKQVTPCDTLEVTVNDVPANSERLLYECKEFGDMPFVLSGIYAPEDVVGAEIFENTADYSLGFTPTNLQESNYLEVKFKLSINGSGYIEVGTPLTLNNSFVELLPLTTYMYNITVSETFIHTILEVTPLNSWEDIEFGFEIKDNTLKIDLGTFQYTNWEEGGWNTDVDSKNN